MTSCRWIACLVLILWATTTQAATVFEQKIDAAPSASTRYDLPATDAKSGTLVVKLTADFISVHDTAPRHVFHLWADPFNRVDATYNPVESRLEVVWTADGHRNWVRGGDLYWQGASVHEIALTWAPAPAGEAGPRVQLSLIIDGRQVDTTDLAEPLSQSFKTLALGAGDIGQPFVGTLHSFRLDGIAIQEWTEVPVVDGPQWVETPEELATLARFNATQRVAYLAHVRGAKALRQIERGEMEFEEYGIKMTKINEAMINAGWLDEHKPTVLYGPGGGADNPSEEASKRIRAYVEGGAGYFGICAGANYAMTIGLLDGGQRIKFSGLQHVGMQFDPTHPIFKSVESFAPGEPHTAYYLHYSGPVWQPQAYPQAKPIMVFDQGTGVAMWEASIGKGRVVVSSPHPEMSEWGRWQASQRNALQQRRIYRQSLYYITGMLDAAKVQ